MEDKDEILKVVKEGFAEVRQQFARIDQRFASVDQRFESMDQRFESMDQRFASIDQRFASIDQQFATLRKEFAEQLDMQTTAYRIDLEAGLTRVREALHSRINGVEIKLEKLDDHVGLVGENVANVKNELAAYHARIEAPVEQRVSALEVRVSGLERKNKPS